MDVFKEILPAIMNIKTPRRLPPDAGYNPFLINRALSYHFDCILHANAMNMVHALDKEMQFDYYINSIRSKKRSFKRWHKRPKEEAVAAVMEYYKYSRIKAEEALNVLSNDQIDEIKKRISKGGLDDRRARRLCGDQPTRAR